MRNQSNTALIMYGIFLTVLMYDLGAVVLYGTPSSVSQFITDATGLSILQAMGVGALADHFCGFVMTRRMVRCPKCECQFDCNSGKIIGEKE